MNVMEKELSLHPSNRRMSKDLKSQTEKAQLLSDLENNIQALFQRELSSVYKIGAYLEEIKSHKLYRYKDMSRTYTWEEWASEFIGSHDTANRYVMAFKAIKLFQEQIKTIKDLSRSRLYEIAPLLLKASQKEAQELINLALAAPSLKEIRIGIRQKNYSLEEITAGEHDHKWVEYHFNKCSICQEVKDLMIQRTLKIKINN